MKRFTFILLAAVILLAACKSPGEKTAEDLDIVRKNAAEFLSQLDETDIEHISVSVGDELHDIHGVDHCREITEALANIELIPVDVQDKYAPGAQSMTITLSCGDEKYSMTLPIYTHEYKGEYGYFDCKIEDSDALLRISELLATYDTPTENTCPYALMAQDTMYYYTEKVWDKIDEDSLEIIGRVTSTIPETRMPSQNGEANIEIADAPYAKYGDGLIVKINNEWIFFEVR